MQPADHEVAESCDVCLRPKYSPADLRRWEYEVAEITKLGGEPLKHNPEWARAICWTNRSYRCVGKPAVTSP